MNEPKKKSFYTELSKAEQEIVQTLSELEVHGSWETLFFRDAKRAADMLKPNVVNYLIAMNVLGTMQQMREFLAINLEIAKGKQTPKKMRIQATVAATEIGKVYAALMDNIIEKTQREAQDEKSRPPAPPSFYATEQPATAPATNGESTTLAETSG